MSNWARTCYKKFLILNIHKYLVIFQAMVNVQMLSELEEVIQYKLVPERRDAIKQMWWLRLDVSWFAWYLCGQNLG